MSFATTQASNQTMGPAGVYKMPPFGIPAPQPNQAMYSLATDVFNKLTIVSLPAVTMKGTIPMSLADAAGSMGGVVSGKIMGPANAVKGSAKLFMGGKECVRNIDPNTHNDKNIVGMTLAPSQTKVQVLS